MTPLIKSVLFDLDGTLIDTAPDFHRVTNQVMDGAGLTSVDFATIRTVASNGALAMLDAALVSQRSDLDPKSLLTQFLEIYEREPVREGGLFEGIATLIDRLDAKQIPWGVVTNKPRQMSIRVLEQLELGSRCRTLICPEDVAKTKPDPEGLLLAARQLGLKPRNCLYLGDHIRDIQAGRAAGMPTLACGFGYLAAGESHLDWQADFAVDSDLELCQLIHPLLADDSIHGESDV